MLNTIYGYLLILTLVYSDTIYSILINKLPLYLVCVIESLPGLVRVVVSAPVGRHHHCNITIRGVDEISRNTNVNYSLLPTKLPANKHLMKSPKLFPHSSLSAVQKMPLWKVYCNSNMSIILWSKFQVTHAAPDVDQHQHHEQNLGEDSD